MKQKYKIITDITSTRKLEVSPGSAKAIGLGSRKIAYLRFGIKVCEVTINVSQEREDDRMSLSLETINELRIPLFAEYEIILNKNEIVIGPFIGIMAERTEGDLRETVEHLKSYVYNYEKIGGAVLAFSPEGIDKETELIKGYMFNPENESWEEGIYCYPSSIFKRVGIVKELREHFYSRLGDTVLNNYVFNKWEAHRWLTSIENTKQYIPYTIIYETSKDIVDFLKEYGTAYIKPIYGSQGTGIIKMQQKGNWFFAYYSIEGREVETCLKDNNELKEFLKNRLNKGKFIIQKSLDLISTEDRTIDFRLLILKDGSGEWRDIGMIARHGVKGSITSNVSTGGSAELGEITLKNILGLSDEDVSKLRKKMSKAAIAAARALEECGLHCGNLGVDMGLDTNRNIWIIEINNINPNHTIAINAGDKQMFYLARLYNMLYAKKLAGF